MVGRLKVKRWIRSGEFELDMEDDIRRCTRISGLVLSTPSIVMVVLFLKDQAPGLEQLPHRSSLLTHSALVLVDSQRQNRAKEAVRPSPCTLR